MQMQISVGARGGYPFELILVTVVGMVHDGMSFSDGVHGLDRWDGRSLGSIVGPGRSWMATRHLPTVPDFLPMGTFPLRAVQHRRLDELAGQMADGLSHSGLPDGC